MFRESLQVMPGNGFELPVFEGKGCYGSASPLGSEAYQFNVILLELVSNFP